MVRILGVGDVVGRPGRKVLRYFLPKLREERGVDFVVVNAENAANGSGITEKIFHELRGYGADVITMGDHAYKRRESCRSTTPRRASCGRSTGPPARPARAPASWRARAVCAWG